MLVCPVGDIFLGSIDTTGNKKDKGYIAQKLIEYIEAVGPQNVVQICSDNASAMLGAMDKVVEIIHTSTSKVVQLTSLIFFWKIGARKKSSRS